jgi:hypothetical protein
LRAATNLNEEELNGRLQEQEQIIAQQRAKDTVQVILADVQLCPFGRAA